MANGLRVLGAMLLGAAVGAGVTVAAVWLGVPHFRSGMMPDRVSNMTAGAVLGGILGGTMAGLRREPGCLAAVIVIACILYGSLGGCLVGGYNYRGPRLYVMSGMCEAVNTALRCGAAGLVRGLEVVWGSA